MGAYDSAYRPDTATEEGITVDEQIEALDLPETENSSHPMDTPDVLSRFRQVTTWRNQAMEWQTDFRVDCAEDRDYYDGDQWAEEDATELEERGQKAIVFNRIKPAIDWILGTEKRARVDFRVLPRGAEDAGGAEAKTKLLKYLSDVNKATFAHSTAFADAVKGGIGWLECGVRGDWEDEPLYIRREDWRYMWYDPFAVELDLSDARYVLRRKWVDVDIACAMFPDRWGAVRAAAINHGSYYDYDDVDEETALFGDFSYSGEGSYTYARSRVCLEECWYRYPTKTQIIRGKGLGTLNGSIYDEGDPSMSQLVNSGYASVHDAIKMQIRCMVFTGNSVLLDVESPYKHNRFPFVPIWGYRKAKDNSPYGVIRNLRDPQDDLNKRRSKALYILSTRQVVADNDAVEDRQELMDEVNRPDGMIFKRPGSELRIEDNRDLAEEHVQLMVQDAEYIEATSGVTDELMGRDTNATSGTAIQARQMQGHVTTAELFDNMRYARQILGEMELSLIEQYYTEHKVVRILGDRGNMDFEEINGIDEQTGEPINDITASQADFVVDSANYNATVRQAMFESMMELMGRMPAEVSIQLLDMVVDLSDLPGKEEMVKRIRAINGQTDPDEDTNDPEVQQERMARAQQAQEQAERERQQEALEMEVKAAKSAKDRADATAKLSKVKLDQEGLRINRAKALFEIDSKERAEQEKDQELRPRGTGPYIPANI